MFAAYADAFERALASPRERMRIVLLPLDPACVCVGETPGAGLPGQSDLNALAGLRARWLSTWPRTHRSAA